MYFRWLLLVTLVAVCQEVRLSLTTCCHYGALPRRRSAMGGPSETVVVKRPSFLCLSARYAGHGDV